MNFTQNDSRAITPEEYAKRMEIEGRYANVLADPKLAPPLIEHASIIASKLGTMENALAEIRDMMLGAPGLSGEAYPRVDLDNSLSGQLDAASGALNRIDDIINQIRNRLF